MSNIEWTEKTWNPTTGCSEISPGCTNCYAAKMAWRIVHMNTSAAKDYEGTVKKLDNGRVVWTGKVNLLADRLLEPVKTKKPTTWFVDSMSDLFHEDIPFEFIDKVFAVMMLCPQHIFQVLTKRTKRMEEYLDREEDMDNIGEACEIIVSENPHLFHELEEIPSNETYTKHYVTTELLPHLKEQGWGWWHQKDEDGLKDGGLMHEGQWPGRHIWIGTSVEDQKRADQRRESLYKIRDFGWLTWVSNEPCIGPIDWQGWEFLSWMVTGGESGKNARPMHPDWARQARDFCKAHNIPFFFKQWGEYYTSSFLLGTGEPFFRMFPSMQHWINKASTRVQGGVCISIDGILCKRGEDFDRCQYPVAIMDKMGKHKSGRILDGKTHDAYPKY